jgi:hypothetical protein
MIITDSIEIFSISVREVEKPLLRHPVEEVA